MMNEKTYPCEFCDTAQVQVKKMVTVTRQRGGQWFIFEDVPAWVCPHCGHRYFDADVLETMEDRIKSTPPDARVVTAWAMSLSEKAS
jgi:YgiT-type zinc finger domain-containing protein